MSLDLAAFRACQDDPTVAQAVAAERSAGQAVPVNSTPSLIVGGELMVGVPAWADLKAAILPVRSARTVTRRISPVHD